MRWDDPLYGPRSTAGGSRRVAAGRVARRSGVATLLAIAAVVVLAPTAQAACRISAFDPADDLACQVYRVARHAPRTLLIPVPDRVDVIDSWHAYGRDFLSGRAGMGRLGDLRVSDRWVPDGIALRYRSVGAPTRFTFGYSVFG